uniref:Membrane protein insertion efficiency factor n=1 Tax=Odontella aurita TaxID=265563 RepID=A0A7S4IWZ1_9STRA|eukprot:CAMPEP_0113531266 /NCGR_PEP_ID=MMETSP0015_2-20120614/3402_1 /TAXON_ID=2838 /ORGANISM="Odontella" /LENGTH=239 /DNA_ID=CAMNT_0000430085 /DNA_START=14 /DNA_END=733 /DNA_ORIENTATION=- /assembly_acc=CAM_ASM_000160
MAVTTQRHRAASRRLATSTNLTTKALLLILITLLSIQISLAAAACGSCLLSLSVAGNGASRGISRGHSNHYSLSHVQSKGSASTGAPFLGLIAARMIATNALVSKGLRWCQLSAFAADSNDADGDSASSGLFDEDGSVVVESPADRGVPETNDSDGGGTTSASMVAAIGFYKNFISPLLPPACRFVPTCSQYGVQAIKEFGPGKGSLLTTWRLMRCSPLGGKGYDPPRWPPVPYNYASY